MIREKVIRYLKSAKMLYFICVIIAFVVVRGVLPLSFNHTKSEVYEEVLPSKVPTSGIATEVKEEPTTEGVTTSIYAVIPSSSSSALQQKNREQENVSMVKSKRSLPLGEERKAFGNSEGLGYTIKEFNQMTEQELLVFHGVGAVTARAIVELRKARGGFRTFDELLDVRGIGPAKLKKILGE